MAKLRQVVTQGHMTSESVIDRIQYIFPQVKAKTKKAKQSASKKRTVNPEVGSKQTSLDTVAELSFIPFQNVVLISSSPLIRPAKRTKPMRR